MAPSNSCSRSGGRPYALVWSPIPVISWLLPCIGHIGVCSSSGRTYDFAGPYTVNEEQLLFGLPTRYLPLNTASTPSGKSSGSKSSLASALSLSDGAPASPGAVGPSVPGGADDVESHLHPDYVAAVGSGEKVSAFAPFMEPDGSGRHTHVVGDMGDGGSGGAGTTGYGNGHGGGSSGGGMGGSATAAAHSWDHRLAFAATTYRLLNYNIMTNNCHCFVAHFLNQAAYRGGGWNMVNLAALMFIHARFTSLGGLMHTWLPWVLLVAIGGYFGGSFFFLCYAAVCVPLVAWFLLYTWCCWRDLRF